MSLFHRSRVAGGAANLSLKSDNDAWGTVASLAREIDEATPDGKYVVCTSACLYSYRILELTKLVDSEGGDRTTTPKKIDNKMQARLPEFYNICYPDSKILARNAPIQLIPQDCECYFLRFYHLTWSLDMLII